MSKSREVGMSNQERMVSGPNTWSRAEPSLLGQPGQFSPLPTSSLFFFFFFPHCWEETGGPGATPGRFVPSLYAHSICTMEPAGSALQSKRNRGVRIGLGWHLPPSLFPVTSSQKEQWIWAHFHLRCSRNSLQGLPS